MLKLTYTIIEYQIKTNFFQKSFLRTEEKFKFVLCFNLYLKFLEVVNDLHYS